MEDGTSGRNLASWLMNQPKGDHFRLTPEDVDGIEDFDELSQAVHALVARGYVEVLRNPIGATYVKPTALGVEVLWGAVQT